MWLCALWYKSGILWNVAPFIMVQECHIVECGSVHYGTRVSYCGMGFRALWYKSAEDSEKLMPLTAGFPN
jgi:hypothetical protein